MTEKLTINSKETLSPVVYEQLKEVLGEKYDYASTVVTYAEVQSLEFNYTGMAEFRDALTHVKRAIYLDDIAEAQDELNSASEHIRRAAVESMQEYIESRYISLYHFNESGKSPIFDPNALKKIESASATLILKVWENAE